MVNYQNQIFIRGQHPLFLHLVLGEVSREREMENEKEETRGSNWGLKSINWVDECINCVGGMILKSILCSIVV